MRGVSLEGLHGIVEGCFFTWVSVIPLGLFIEPFDQLLSFSSCSIIFQTMQPGVGHDNISCNSWTVVECHFVF